MEDWAGSRLSASEQELQDTETLIATLESDTEGSAAALSTRRHMACFSHVPYTTSPNPWPACPLYAAHHALGVARMWLWTAALFAGNDGVPTAAAAADVPLLRNSVRSLAIATGVSTAT